MTSGRRGQSASSSAVIKSDPSECANVFRLDHRAEDVVAGDVTLHVARRPVVGSGAAANTIDGPS